MQKTIEKSETTVIFINQVRDKFGAMMFGEKTDTPGGRALKFYSSVRIQVARRMWITIPNKDPKNSAAEEKVGLVMRVKVIKSKICNPYGEAELPFFFDRGFVSADDVKSIRLELMKKNNEKVKQNKHNIKDDVLDDLEEDEDEE